MEQARHAEERGAILQALKQDYGAKMTSVRALSRALDLVGHGMRPAGMQFALTYLADSQYIQIWRFEDTPGFRADRDSEERRDQIVFARLMPRGLQLIDGQIAADPSVSF
jgi:hypothetical protein